MPPPARVRLGEALSANHLPAGLPSGGGWLIRHPPLERALSPSNHNAGLSLNNEVIIK
jgi:hypothetical protein